MWMERCTQLRSEKASSNNKLFPQIYFGGQAGKETRHGNERSKFDEQIQDIAIFRYQQEDCKTKNYIVFNHRRRCSPIK